MKDGRLLLKQTGGILPQLTALSKERYGMVMDEGLDRRQYTPNG